ncbi:uncharacterized protein LOC128667752 [Microplitis demolitor]|uniref:uncharacterized protein LOC128667752 n=1 Tax=Microplitis demolitor TaxID=69319 RepID=UPI0004CD6605|nr:uncharacterized protein LOC128667752 [Microplitis demolitor]
MNLKSCLLLITYFLVQDATAENRRLDTYDINSIQVFVNNVHERARSDYRLENTTLKDDEKNNVLEMIFNDLTNILTELNKMSNDPRKILSSGELISIVDSLEKHDLKTGFSAQPKLSVKLNTIFNISETINSYVEPLLKLGSSNFSGERDMSEFCPSNKSIQPNIEFKFEQPIVLNEYKKFIDNFAVIMNNKTQHDSCGQTSSLNQAIFDYHHQVVATYLKEYILLNFVDIIDGRCYDWNVIPLLNTRRIDSMKELSEIIKLTKNLLDNNSVYIYRCDADYRNNAKGKSYYELERMIQHVIYPEKELSTTGSCKHNCDLSTIKNSINDQGCKELTECRFIHDTYDICKTTGSYSSRRYEWFANGAGYIYGNSYPHCRGNVTRFSVSSYLPMFTVHYCNYCVCKCVSKPKRRENVVTALSFMEQVSNIRKNMVVVGVRFVKKDYMIHVQIKEREFKSNSTDNRGSWKELKSFDYDDNMKKYYKIHDELIKIELKLGTDYGHPKKIHFDDLMAPKGYVVTGVRFRFAGDSLIHPSYKSGAIQLQIRVTPFDYATGLNRNFEKSRWIGQPTMRARKELTLDAPDKPTKSFLNVIDSKTDQFIKFRESDFIKDAGQSTVPFFDAQDVEGTPEFPLGGVGIVHRGRKGYGGFLAFKIFDLNLSNCLNGEPQSQQRNKL